MKRRALLATGGSALGALLAGCTSDGTGDGGSQTPSPSPTDAPPRVTSRSFTASDPTCGGQVEKASVSSESSDGYRVVVTGTTSTPTPCYRAELQSATYDGERDELTVTVVTAETDAEMCAQCIAEIDYEASVSFENGLPETVVVRHDGERVTKTEL